jgi:hypothetical protein
LSSDISALIRKCESKVKQIALKGNEAGKELSAEDRMVRLNIMKSMGRKLDSLTKQYRKVTNDFLRRVEANEETGKSYFAEEDAYSAEMEQLTAAQMAALDEVKIVSLCMFGHSVS